MKYRFVQFDPKGKRFEVKEDPLPKLKSGETLVRVLLCTICGSDLHSFAGRRKTANGAILGHEIVGEIVEWNGNAPVDFDGRKLGQGDRITWTMAVGCGNCYFCKRWLNQKCEALVKYGHGPNRMRGGLSEFVSLTPETSIFRVPESLSNDVVCPANCATATVCAAFRLVSQTHLVEKETVLVSGAGMLGLTAVAYAKNLKADRILIADPIPQRRRLAFEFGATHEFDPTDLKAMDACIGQVTKGRGVDIALDFAGVPAAVSNCLDQVRIGGCILLAGSVFPTARISISPEKLVRKMVTLRGLHNYLPEDLGQAIQFLEQTNLRFPFADLVEKSFLLEQTQAAFEFAESHHPVRIAIQASS